MKSIMEIFRNKKQFGYRCIWLLSVVLLLSSCKTKQETGSAVSLKQRNNQELISAVLSNTVEYDKFSAKLGVKLKPGLEKSTTSVPASLRIIKGQALMLSLQIPILNAEVFRMVVTPDSLLLIDRRSKMYVSEALKDIQNVANFAFEYQNLEALFTNQLFIAGKTEITPADYSLFQVEQTEYEAQFTSEDNQGITYSFISDYTDRIRKAEIKSTSKSNNSTQMNWWYDDFELIKDRVFPVKVKMGLVLPSDEIMMDLSYSKIELDGNFSIEFQIPKNSRRITLSQALETINNL